MVSLLTPPTTSAAAVHDALEANDERRELALTTKASAAKVANLDTVRRLAALIDKQMPGTSGRWSRNTLARALGVSVSYVSIYLAQIDERGEPAANPPEMKMDVVKLEDAIEAFLGQLSQRRELSSALHETPITRGFATFANQVIAARQWGVYHGPAGDGKTSAARFYAVRNPLAVLVTATQWACGAGALQGALFTALNAGGRWRGNTPRMEWVVEQLKGSARFILCVNAHRWTQAALTTFADLHDETGVPIIMEGSPAVLDRLARDPQISSRVKQKEESSWGKESRTRLKHWNEAAERLLLRDAPDYVADLLPLAVQVIQRPGGQRALEAHIRLAMAYLERAPERGAEEAFRGAHDKLIHDGYKLD